MAKAKGMEFLSEFILIPELDTRLEKLNADNWAVVSVTSVHANTFELGDRAHILVVFSRPKK